MEEGSVKGVTINRFKFCESGEANEWRFPSYPTCIKLFYGLARSLATPRNQTHCCFRHHSIRVLGPAVHAVPFLKPRDYVALAVHLINACEDTDRNMNHVRFLHTRDRMRYIEFEDLFANSTDNLQYIYI